MKYSCGHKADPLLPKATVIYQKWCANCDPEVRTKRKKQEQEARQRNRKTQRALNLIGRGEYGPLPDENPFLNWNPTPEQFRNAVRALAIWGPVLDRKDGEP